MSILRPATRLGDYQIVRHLGTGRFAHVHEALHKSGERRALKIVRADLRADRKAHDRLHHEAEVIADVEHPNLVRFFDGGVFEGRLWIAVELVPGVDLRRFVGAAGGRLPVADVVAILRQVAEGVAAVHRRGIVHRDIKPENILVTADLLAKLIDFGSVRLEAWGVETTLDQEGNTVRYRAPEALQKHTAVLKSDVFSLGVVLYELLTGANPIADERESLGVVTKRLAAYQPPPRLDRPGDLADLVERALAVDPDKRPTARELADGLDVALNRLRRDLREVARALPLSEPDEAYARTEQALPATGPRGTMTMPSASAPESPSGPSAAGPSAAAGDAEPLRPRGLGAPTPGRSTTLPPLPAAIPVTLKTAFAPEPRARAVPVTAPMAEVVAPLDRRTTGMAVERAALRPSAAAREAGARSRAARVVAVAVVVGAGSGAAAWLLVAPGDRAPAPASAPSPTARAPVSAAPAASSAAPPRAAPPARKTPRSKGSP